MTHQNDTITMWGIGISEEDAELIRHASGKEFTLTLFDTGFIPDVETMDEQEPALVWMSRETWNIIKASSRLETQHLEIIPRVLVMGGTYSLQELEEALENGFTDVIKPPLTEHRIKDVLLKAVETQGLYQDIMRMTREVVLEREMLARKNDILSFIVSFLARATESLDPVDIIAGACEDLSDLLPLKAMGSICWASTNDESMEATLTLPVYEQSPAHSRWVDLLIASAEKSVHLPVSGYQVAYLPEVDQEVDLSPDAGKMIIMPLKAGGEAIGAIALLAEDELQLGKDQVQILHSAMQHLALALRNAMLFREVKQHADYDGLTHIHNRRHFETTLRNELERHSRYQQPLTLMMLDIDHFKAVNDTYGHQAGDSVLREVATIVRKTIRNTDYVARYGGEEFAVILPHTTEEQGYALAERLREQIAARPFIHQNMRLRATISIGLTSLPLNTLKKTDTLVQEADEALYYAKSNGRNVVCTANDCAEREAQVG